MSIALFGGLMSLIFLPMLLATMIADLTWWKAFALTVVAVAIAGYVVIGRSETFQSLYWHWTMPTAPASEAAFVSAAEALRNARADFAGGGHDRARLHQAEQRLCALPSQADDWSGKVAQMFLTAAGDGASLAVAVAPHLVLHTALFRDNSGTLIAGDAPLFAKARTLREGDILRFSGVILGHDGACPGDPPVSRNEVLRDPDFLFRFARIQAPVAH
jgi:hypothetical protein